MCESNIQKIVAAQRSFFAKGKTLDVRFRASHLIRLQHWIDANEAAILDALRADLGKSRFEGYMTEIGIVRGEIACALRNLRQWSRPERVFTPISQFPAKNVIFHEPYGVALIMSPWNYPFHLTVLPLVSAIAAGNCAVLKPSADSPSVSALLARMADEVFGRHYTAVVQGGRQENQSLLEQRFDVIFFTGSPAVGRVVMEAAAKHLTPVTLELGGKSPCIVDETADIDLAAKRIIWGKCLNAGQTCVAPDYVLVQKSVKEKLIACMKKYIRKMYGFNPCMNPEYPKIVNEKHFNRLAGLLETGTIVCGGALYPEFNKIAPTLITDVTPDSPVMQEEIFGPILPILEIDTVEEAVQFITSRPKPLALYLFTRCRSCRKNVLRGVRFGGGCVNDVILHLAASNMPFGGVGESGMGAYHGKAGFDAFTHKKSILLKSNVLDIPVRYPPYGEDIRLLKRLL